LIAIPAAADPLIPRLRIHDVTVIEGQQGTVLARFEVTLSEASFEDSLVSVSFATHDDVAGVADGDYVATQGRLWFNAGQISRQVTVPVIGDRVHEPDETFFVDLSDPKGATIVTGRGIGTILNEDAIPVISISDVQVLEGSTAPASARFVVRLDHPSSEKVSVRFATQDGTARVSDLDYVAANGTLEIPPRAAQVELPVAVIPDFKAEPDETFLVTLADAVGAELGEAQAVGTILDDDHQPPTLRIEDAAAITEGNAGVTTARFRVVLSHPAAVVVPVSFATVAGTAHAGEDFAPNSGTFGIAVGDTTDTIGVAVIGDLAREPNETFEVEIESSGDVIVIDNRATGLILDDDRLVARFTPGFAAFPPYLDGTLAPAWGDYDRDGLPDLPLYHNDGPAGFSEIPGFRDLLGQGNFHGSAWCDYDRDGRLDLVITGYADGDSMHTLVLHQRTDGTFEDLGPPLGIGIVGHGETAVWADFDADGWPDLYVPYYPQVPPYRSMFYHGEGGTFSEIGEVAGVAMIGQTEEFKPEGATAADWDGDGDIDLYAGSHLFVNDGSGTFTDVRAELGLPLTFDEGAMFLDYDNDGDLDFYLRDAIGPRLFRHDGGGFVETTTEAGLPPVPEWGYGDAWADVDHDGDLDLVYFVREGSGRLMLNRGDGTFVPDSAFEALGIYVDMACFGDADGDGDLDLLAGSWPKVLYLNSLAAEPGFADSYLRVRVLDERGNRDENGVTVHLERLDVPAGIQTRIVGGGSSYLAQNEYDVHFGVAPEGRYALEVVFPGGAGGKAVVDPTVDPELGAIDPRRLVDKTIVVYRNGRVTMDAMPVAGTPRPSTSAATGLGARPQPMRGSGTLSFALERGSRVSLTVFDVSGRRVRTIVRGFLAAGSHAARWDLVDDRGDRVPAGVYLARLLVDDRPAGATRIVVTE
jgi:hypothetical protein